MAAVIKRRKVDEGLLQLLVEELQFEVGLVDPPEVARAEGAEENDDLKYVILQPIEGGEFYGAPWTAPEQDVELPYQVTCVGVDWRMATWVADEVRRVMCARDAHGVLVHELTLEEHTVMDREQITPIGVPRLESGAYQVVDSYTVKVERA